MESIPNTVEGVSSVDECNLVLNLCGIFCHGFGLFLCFFKEGFYFFEVYRWDCRKDDLEGKYVYGGTFVALLNALIKRKGKDNVALLMKDMVEHGYTGPTKVEDFKLKGKYKLKDYLIFFERGANMFGIETTDQMSRDGAKKEGIWGWFIKLAGTPAMVMKKSGDYWKEFYDFGEMWGEMVDEKTARLYLKDGCYSHELCSGHTAYFVGIFESIGQKNVKCVHKKCTLKGDDVGMWEITWD